MYAEMRTEIEVDYSILKTAIMVLASVDDGAIRRDGTGFNAYDSRSEFVGYLIKTPYDRWSCKVKRAAWGLLQKYQRQLMDHGINVTTIPEPPVPASASTPAPTQRIVEGSYSRSYAGGHEKEKSRITIDSTDTDWVISYPRFRTSIADSLKPIPGARYIYGKDHYLVPKGQSIAFSEVVRKHDVEFTPRAQEDFRSFIAEVKEKIEKSNALHSDIKIEGLQLTPRSFQLAGVDYLASVKRAILADDMGLGKSGEIIMTAQYTSSWPLLIVCPKSLKYNWVVELDKWLAMGDQAVILGGRIKPEESGQIVEFLKLDREIKKYSSDPESYASSHIKTINTGTQFSMGVNILSEDEDTLHIFCRQLARAISPEFSTLYEQWKRLKLRLGPVAKLADAKMVVINYDVTKWWVPALSTIPFQMIACDEGHVLKNLKAQRTMAVQKLMNNIEYKYVVTGSPLLNRPNELIAPLTLLGRLEEFGGWYKFVREYCNAHRDRFGWNIRGHGDAKVMQGLHQKLRATCFIRRRKSEVLTELPPKVISTIEVDIDNRAEYAEAEYDIVKWVGIKAKEDKEFNDSIAHLSPEEQAVARRKRQLSAEYKALAAEHLVKISKLKQLVAKGKMKEIIDLVKTYQEAGEKLIVFAWHKDIVKMISDEFGCPMITGDTGEAERQRIVEEFQKNDEALLIAANIRAGGVGLTLTGTEDRPCSNILMVELDWSPKMHEQAEDRIYRLGTRATSVNIWYVLGKNTIDEKIFRMLQSKAITIDNVVDGVIGPSTSSVMDEITDWIKNKVA